jgi:hypothetical protein
MQRRHAEDAFAVAWNSFCQLRDDYFVDRHLLFAFELFRKLESEHLNNYRERFKDIYKR